jgi:hypothetical protein
MSDPRFCLGSRVWLRAGAGHTEHDAGIVAELRFNGAWSYVVQWPGRDDEGDPRASVHPQHCLTATVPQLAVLGYGPNCVTISLADAPDDAGDEGDDE